MLIEIVIKDKNGSFTWKEKYSIDNYKDPKEYAQDLINKWNNTLRSFDKPREIVDVIVLDDVLTTTEHNWEKQNLVTIISKNGNYDVMKCKKCGITGKRYGLGQSVQRDTQYKAKLYSTCEGAIKQLKKLKEKEN